MDLWNLKIRRTKSLEKRRLEEAVRKSRALPPEQIIKALYEAVLAFSGGTKQMDDLTAVLVKRV